MNFLRVLAEKRQARQQQLVSSLLHYRNNMLQRGINRGYSIFPSMKNMV
jgi:hypothetical protein